eukprot:gene10837-37_t
MWTADEQDFVEYQGSLETLQQAEAVPVPRITESLLPIHMKAVPPLTIRSFDEPTEEFLSQALSLPAPFTHHKQHSLDNTSHPDEATASSRHGDLAKNGQVGSLADLLRSVVGDPTRLDEAQDWVTLLRYSAANPRQVVSQLKDFAVEVWKTHSTWVMVAVTVLCLILSYRKLGLALLAPRWFLLVFLLVGFFVLVARRLQQ